MAGKAILIKQVPEDVHRSAKLAAVREGCSLMAWITTAIMQRLARQETPPTAGAAGAGTATARSGVRK
jgi:hypothetical protein